MSAEVLTTWGVVLELEGKIAELQPDSTSRWFAESRDAFFKLCPRLAAFLQAEKTELQLTDEHVEPLDNTSGTGGLKIGASVIEVRPSSFEMAVRIRPLGDHPAPPANGRSTLVFRRRSTGERLPIPGEVRDEFVAIQLAARQIC
jgi:acyl-CoA thioesterase FadM